MRVMESMSFFNQKLTHLSIMYILIIYIRHKLSEGGRLSTMNILISNTSGEPIYAQIVGQIRQYILQGDMSAGTALPSIRQLAKDLQISVITTKRAYEELEREGLINSIVGKGSFVSGADQDFIREQRLRIMEERMRVVVEESKLLQISFIELTEMMKVLYEEEP